MKYFLAFFAAMAVACGGDFNTKRYEPKEVECDCDCPNCPDDCGDSCDCGCSCGGQDGETGHDGEDHDDVGGCDGGVCPPPGEDG